MTANGESTELKEKYLRALADRENLKKRMSGQIDQAVSKERREMLLSFIEVNDSLDQALRDRKEDGNEWIAGMKAVRRQFMEVLKRHGAEPFRAVGRSFDPQRHEAVGRESVPGYPEGAVLRVLRRGYVLSDGAVLRPARVIVTCSRENSIP